MGGECQAAFIADGVGDRNLATKSAFVVYD